MITDSNGRGATSDSVKNHMTREEKGKYVIEVAVAYTLDEAIQRVERGAIDVREAVVVVDNLTNDIRGTRLRPSLNPRELVNGVDKLRGVLKNAGATAAVICEVKPMQLGDVTPYNRHLADYLSAQKWGFGCRTQIRLNYLKPDGFHVRPQFDSVIDRTYACAIRGIYVNDPTPAEGFVPDYMRRRWQAEWPRLGGRSGQTANHGW